MSEVLRVREPLRGGQGERCPGAMLRWAERGESPHHWSPQEMVEAHRSLERINRHLIKAALLDCCC